MNPAIYRLSQTLPGPRAAAPDPLDLPLGLGLSASAPPSRYRRHRWSSGLELAIPKRRIASGLAMPPVDHGARRGDLGLEVVSRVRLPHAQQAAPHGSACLLTFSHSPGGDAEPVRDGFVVMAGREQVRRELPERLVVLRPKVGGHGEAPHFLNFFSVQEMGGSSVWHRPFA